MVRERTLHLILWGGSFRRQPWRRALVLLLGAVFFCVPAVLRAQNGAINDSIERSATETGSRETAPAERDLGTGNFTRSPFRVSVSVREGYDDNVYTANLNPVGSFFTNGSATVEYKFGNARTTFDLEAFGGLTYFYNRPFGQTYDINSGLTISASHKATPRLGFGASVYLTYQSEPDINTGIGLNRRTGNYFYTNDKFSISYLWTPRFSTVTSYTLGAIQYEDSAIGSFEDRFEHTFGNEFRYLVLPTTSLVGEYRYQIIDFDLAPRDSTTHFVLAGLDHSFSPRFNASLRGGAQFRQFDTFGERTSPYGEATVKYTAGPRTSISWTNRYGLDEPDVPGASSRTTYRTGLVGSYGVSPRITTTLSLYYQHDANDSVVMPFFVLPAFTEDSIDINLGLRYDITRTYAVIGGFTHTEIFSELALRDYARNRYFLGFNASF